MKKETVFVICAVVVVGFLMVGAIFSEPSPEPKPVTQRFYRHTIVISYINDKLPSDTLVLISPRRATRGVNGAFRLTTWTSEGVSASHVTWCKKTTGDFYDKHIEIATDTRSFKVINTESIN